jgi:hypothetical protein
MSQQGFQPRAFKIENLDGAAKAVRTMVDDSGQVWLRSFLFVSIRLSRSDRIRCCRCRRVIVGVIVGGQSGAPPPNSLLTAQQWQQQLAQHGLGVVRLLRFRLRVVVDGRGFVLSLLCYCFSDNVVLQGSKLHADVKSMNPDNIDATLLAGFFFDRFLFVCRSEAIDSVRTQRMIWLPIATARQLALVTGNMLAAAHSTAGTFVFFAQATISHDDRDRKVRWAATSIC